MWSAQSHSGLKARARAFFLFIVLPAWLGPGLLDWYFHRRSHIERPGNGGLPESLIHCTMFAEGGVPLLLGASFEMNPLLVTLMTGAAVAHEATAMADVRLALKSGREVSQWEQHTHSFLEVMPFWIAPLMALLHEPMTKAWGLKRRASALSKRDVTIIAAAVAILGALPYAEEFVRCARAARPKGVERSDPEEPSEVRPHNGLKGQFSVTPAGSIS